MSVPTIGGQAALISSLAAQTSAGSAINATGGAQKGFQYGFLTANVGTNPTLATVTVKLQDSADNVTFADVSGASLSYSAAETGTKVAQIRLDGVKEYVRVVLDDGGTSGVIGSADLIGFPNKDTDNYTPTSLEFDV
jgi:hypothetical protein